MQSGRLGHSIEHLAQQLIQARHPEGANRYQETECCLLAEAYVNLRELVRLGWAHSVEKGINPDRNVPIYRYAEQVQFNTTGMSIDQMVKAAFGR